MYFSHFASYLALMIILISIALSLVYMLCGFSLHYLYMCSSSEPTTTNIKWKNCIIWYYLCINVAIDEVIYGASSTPEKQRSTTKQQHHLKIRQMSRNCRQANRPEPNQLHMKRMHIYPIHWIESNQVFFSLFFFLKLTTYKAKQGAKSQWAYRGERDEHKVEHVSANTSQSKK